MHYHVTFDELIMISSSSFFPLTRKEETTDKITKWQEREGRDADKEDEAVFWVSWHARYVLVASQTSTHSGLTRNKFCCPPPFNEEENLWIKLSDNLAKVYSSSQTTHHLSWVHRHYLPLWLFFMGLFCLSVSAWCSFWEAGDVHSFHKYQWRHAI